jgi:hypothetical protein
MAAAATSKMGQAVAFVLEFRDAIDHEIVGQGLKTGCRDGIASCAQVTAAAGVTVTSLEIRRAGEASSGGPKAHRLTVAIGCPVMDPERDQRTLQDGRLRVCRSKAPCLLAGPAHFVSQTTMQTERCAGLVV